MIKLNIAGMEEINQKINEARKKYPEQCRKGIELSCITVEAKAKHLVPVKTGRLKASITYAMGGDSKAISFTNKVTGSKDTVSSVSTGSSKFEWYGVVGTIVEYAPYVEFGTRNMSAQPYLVPALYNSKAEIKKIFEDVLRGVKL